MKILRSDLTLVIAISLGSLVVAPLRAAECSGPGLLVSQQADPLPAGTVPFQDLPPFGDGGAADSEAGDDFSVPADTVWFVEAVRAVVAPGGLGDPTPPFGLAFHLDDGGRPGAVVCAASGLAAEALGEPDAQGREVVRIPLPTPCTLCAGTTYWISLQVLSGDPTPYTLVQRSLQTGRPAVWRSPGGGPLGGCSSWGSFADCGVGDGVSADLRYALEGRSASRGFVKGDFNGDRCPDLVFQSADLSQIEIWLMNGATRIGEVSLALPPYRLLPVASTDDFDGDGDNDFLLGDLVSEGWWVWYLRNGAPLSAPVRLEPPAELEDTQHRLMAGGNLAGGREPDGVCQGTEPGSIRVWIAPFTPNSPRPPTNPPLPYSGNWQVKAVADFNGDGHGDLLLSDSATAAIRIAFLTGELDVQDPLGVTVPGAPMDANWRLAGAADLGIGPDAAGDAAEPVCGAQDLLWQNLDSGRVVVWYLNTAGERTAGEFTSPDQPCGETPCTGWRLVGPR